MSCTNCNGDRIVFVNAKCSDMCVVDFANTQIVGYVPNDLGIGGGDYVRFGFCLDCGMMKGEFPLPESDIELLDSNAERIKDLAR